ncbi:MAG TPA: hypothetical protein VHG91_11540 [Longimicrobium sp.]|nr:hypothetical protein [Longimicrobium sp.]
MTLRSRSYLLALAAACALSACDGGPDDPGPVAAGLNFTYAGARSGEHRSGGTPSLTQAGVPSFGAWAMANADSVGGVMLAGFDPTTSPEGNFFILQLRPAGTGSFDCAAGGQGGCHGRFIVGVDTGDLTAAPEGWYEVVDGSVDIAEATATRLVGSFEATLVDAETNDTIHVADGTIDVPFSASPNLSDGINCWARNVQNGTNQPCGN